jgi:hypothetical protein
LGLQWRLMITDSLRSFARVVCGNTHRRRFLRGQPHLPVWFFIHRL